MTDSLNINGITAEQVYDIARKVGTPDADAKLLVSNWIYQNYLQIGRGFAYATSFPASVPDCVPPPFVRSFGHTDWVDGVDLVQAGQTADDDGFNVRFHNIEKDLDALGAKIAALATCTAEMRAALRKMFDEIAGELNRIDNDLGGTVKTSTVVQDAGKLVVPQVAFPSNQLNPGVLPPGSVGDPLVRYLGTTIFQEKSVSLFNTSQGIMILPAVDISTPTATDTRVGAAGALARAVAENEEMQQAMRAPVSKAALNERFGNVTLSHGQTVTQVLSVLPANASYRNGDELLTDLSVRMAGALQSTAGLAQQLASTVSAPANAKSLAAVDVGGMKNLTPQAMSSLRAAGLGTIGQLATAAPDQVRDLLSRGNSGMTVGEIAAAQGIAQTLAHVEI
jgi:hypothetical protein